MEMNVFLGRMNWELENRGTFMKIFMVNFPVSMSMFFSALTDNKPFRRITFNQDNCFAGYVEFFLHTNRSLYESNPFSFFFFNFLLPTHPHPFLFALISPAYEPKRLKFSFFAFK